MALGERPLTLASTVLFVSAKDPAIDWDRIAERELELNPGLADKAVEMLAELRREDPKLELAVARRAAALDAFAMRIGEPSQRNPAITVEELVAKPGEQVTKFRLGVVPRSELTRINDDAKAFTTDARRHELYWRVFLAGLRDIEGGVGVLGVKFPKKKVADVDFIDPAWLRDTFCGDLGPIAHEVGRAIWFWNQFSEADAKK